MSESVGEAMGIEPEVDREINELAQRAAKGIQTVAEGLERLLQEDLSPEEFAVAVFYFANIIQQMRQTMNTPLIFAISGLGPDLPLPNPEILEILKNLEETGPEPHNPQCPCDRCPKAGSCVLEANMRKLFSSPTS